MAKICDFCHKEIYGRQSKAYTGGRSYHCSCIGVINFIDTEPELVREALGVKEGLEHGHIRFNDKAEKQEGERAETGHTQASGHNEGVDES